MEKEDGNGTPAVAIDTNAIDTNAGIRENNASLNGQEAIKCFDGSW